jgi:hypothetical protein
MYLTRFRNDAPSDATLPYVHKQDLLQAVTLLRSIQFNFKASQQIVPHSKQ